jgi:PAS domain S-box-containing protein
MALSLRQRILFSLMPLVCLLAAIGGTGIVLLRRVGDRIDLILRENYESVVAMVGLNEALERIDSSFQFALAGQKDARQAYQENWDLYEKNLEKEQHNITLPGEQELVDELTQLTADYRVAGDRFFAHGPPGPGRAADYFGTPERPGLLQRFRAIKKVAHDIRELNQKNMEEASADARHTATLSQVWLAGGLAATTLLAILLTWRTVRSILGPIQSVTRSALAIGAGNLNQAVPVVTGDEVGQLAEAFNRMARQLRDYRQSHLAQLLRAQRTGQATIDSFPDPVLVVDPDGRVEMANPAARRLLGLPAPADGQAPAVPWQPPEALRQPLGEALQGRRPFRTEEFEQTVAFRLDGEDRAYLPQVLPIHDPYGYTLGAAVVLNDVTRFRLLDQIKSDLVATVSHELKTPLTSVRLVLHLLLEETVGPLTPKQAELLVDARDNAERLLHMIEHLLALARLQHGQDALRLQPEAPQDLLQAAAEAVRPRAEAKHLELAVAVAPGLPAVAADPQRLGHALNNLLDNAVHYTPPGGKVTLSAEAAGADAVRLSVADTGAGIPPEYLPHVFDKFFRVPDRSPGHGTGLGLAIVREIVTAHQGRITCASERDRGTVFHMTLPVWKGQSAVSSQQLVADC